MEFIDAHTHLSFFDDSSNVDRFVELQKAQGITRWINGGFDLNDWNRQILLQSKLKANLILGFGLHPWAVCEKTDEDVEFELSQLRSMLNRAQLMGEVGLDFFKTDDEVQKKRQIKYFKEQLMFSENIPLILHVVKAHPQAFECLDSTRQSFTGIVHGFSGSFETAKEYIRRGFLISIGRGILNNNFKKLRNVVEVCSPKDLVIESDYPSDRSDLKQEYPFFKIAETVAKIKSLDTSEVLNSSRNNLLNLLGELD